MKLPVTLQENEEIILVCRRHIVFLYTKLAGSILAGLIPLVIFLVLAASTSGTGSRLLVVLAVLWGLLWIVLGYFTWYRYTNDEWFVTNQRLIDLVKRHWFNQEIASADLVNVEDMSVSQNGVLQTIFKYGDLKCQTAGVQQNFVLKGIPRPSDVLAKVDAQRDAARRELYGATGQPPGATG
jgi:uncharacterized membrane protein YdbT with pleckstrin-like domain